MPTSLLSPRKQAESCIAMISKTNITYNDRCSYLRDETRVLPTTRCAQRLSPTEQLLSPPPDGDEISSTFPANAHNRDIRPVDIGNESESAGNCSIKHRFRRTAPIFVICPYLALPAPTTPAASITAPAERTTGDAHAPALNRHKVPARRFGSIHEGAPPARTNCRVKIHLPMPGTKPLCFAKGFKQNARHQHAMPLAFDLPATDWSRSEHSRSGT